MLITVHGATATATEGWIDYDITANLGDGEVRFVYTFAPNDHMPINEQLRAWRAAHPTFPVTALDIAAAPSS